MAEKIADRAKARGLAGRVVTLKLKRNDFKLLTRRAALDDGSQIADRIYRVAHGLFAQTDHPKPYRLIGLGLSDLIPADAADRAGDLLDPGQSRRAATERATDTIRARFGPDAIVKGRALR